jgi:predicted ribosome quality control (RQC) complex YloA/Tae2 family protein
VGASKSRVVEYELDGGWRVVAGLSDDDNEYVSLELAEPDDWWFHADDVPGSHVILRARLDVDPDRKTLERAAAIAAYHSKARAAASVQVHVTRARHVKKPRGAKTGTVRIANVSKSKTLKVRPDISFATRVGRGDS